MLEPVGPSSHGMVCLLLMIKLFSSYIMMCAANAQTQLAFLLSTLQKDDDAAAAAFERAVALIPLDAVVRARYASFLRRRVDDMDKAEEQYLMAVHLQPKHPGILGNTASFLFKVLYAFINVKSIDKMGPCCQALCAALATATYCSMPHDPDPLNRPLADLAADLVSSLALYTVGSQQTGGRRAPSSAGNYA